MTTIYSVDGTTVTKRYREAPKYHWVQDDLKTGHYVPADISVGYFPFVQVAQPDADHTRSVARVGDVFTEVWTFDQALVDSRTAEAVVQDQRDAARNAVANLDQYLALGSPTNQQVVGQVERVSRMVRRLIIDQYGAN
jgi:hypothetical protein